MPNRLVIYLGIRRRKAGLSQAELAELLGYKSDATVSMHEEFQSIPPFLMALGYEAIFREPVSRLFAGLYETIERTVDERFAKFEARLQEQDVAGGSKDRMLARKLQWIRERRSCV